jgi:hypothetical protein
MLMRAAMRLVCTILVFNLIISPVATAQQSHPQATNAGSPTTQAPSAPASTPTGTKPTAAPNSTVPPAQPATAVKPSLQSQIAKDATSVFGDIGDYVPCEFTRDALLSLRPTPDVVTLTAKQEDDLRTRIIAEAQDSTNATAFPQGQLQQDYFVKSIAEASFVGLTPSHAIGKVIDLLWQATQTDPDATDLAFAAQGSNKSFADHVQDKFGIDNALLLKALGPQEQAPQAKLQIAAKVAEEQSSEVAKSVPEAKELSDAASKGDTNLVAVLEKSGLDSAAATKALAVSGPSPQEKLSVSTKLVQDKLAADQKPAAANTEAAKPRHRRPRRTYCRWWKWHRK